MMKLCIALNGKKHLGLALQTGRLLSKSAKEYRFQNAVVEGSCGSNECIPVSLAAPGKKVFTMTSGAPATSRFNALYCLETDTAVMFKAPQITIAPPNFRLAGGNISVKIIDHYYQKNFNPLFRRFNKKRFPNPPAGWLSWYCYFNDFDEKKLRDTIAAAKRHFKDFGLEYIQLETWQKNSDKLPVFNYHHAHDAVKFPRGMKHAAGMIKKAGFKAGLWVVPFGTGDKDIYLKNPEMFLKTKDGKPLKSWCGLYTLDPTHPQAKKYIKDMLVLMTKKWGYDYLKIDGIERGGDPENNYYIDTIYDREEVKRVFHKKEKDPLRGMAELVRKSIGPDVFFNVCGGKIKRNGKFVGIGDGARIGGDIFWDGEDPSWKTVIAAAACTLDSYHAHNIFWYNDPDVLSIRDPLPTEYARVLCSILGLSGEMLFLGDILSDLPQNKITLLQRIMPALDTYPAHLVKNAVGPAAFGQSAGSVAARNYGMQPVWNLVIRKPFEQWNVIGVFNWDEKEKMNLRLKMAEVGLAGNRQYLAYDSWNDKFLGIIKGAMDFELPKQSCQVICLREKKNHPQLLALNRHITQGAIGVAEAKWDTGNLALVFDLDLPPKREFVMTLFAPPEYVLKGIRGNAVLKDKRGGLARLTVRSGKTTCCYEYRSRF